MCWGKSGLIPPPNLYEERLRALRFLLSSSGCEGYLVENPTDLYYLTGIQFSAGRIWVWNDCALLVVDGRYFEVARRQTLYQVELQQQEGSSLPIPSEIKDARVGFDQTHTVYQRYQSLVQSGVRLFQRSGQRIEFTPLPSLVAKLRLVKSPYEIDVMRRAAQLDIQGYHFACSQLQEGISEEKVACLLDQFWKGLGARKLSFDPIIAFGKGSAEPHHRAGMAQLSQNEGVLIDIGVEYACYQSDLTRTCFFGTAHPKHQEIYNIVHEAQQEALNRCRPGTPIGELDRVARFVIGKAGYSEFFNHGLGHGVGLDIHEAPIIKESGPDRDLLLAPGMVITIEPGIYLPDLGGVRLEETIVITETGYEILTVG